MRHISNKTRGKDLSKSKLSPQQLRIVVFLSEGWHPEDIAEQLTIEYSTIRAHICNTARKWGVRGYRNLTVLAKSKKRQLVALARAEGVIR